MSNSDDLLQGFLIGTFVFMGITAIGYCVRRVKPTMVKSESMEDLSSVTTEDPPTNV